MAERKLNGNINCSYISLKVVIKFQNNTYIISKIVSMKFENVKMTVLGVLVLRTDHSATMEQ